MNNKNKREWLKKLESDILEYNKIFLVLNDESLTNKQSALFSFFDKIKDRKQNTLILSMTKNPISIHPWITYRQITKIEADYLCYLYHMYEFSDRFFIISKEKQYGELFNFVHIGLLKPEEVWEALVY